MNYLLIFILKVCVVWGCFCQVLSTGVGFAEFKGENGVAQLDAFSVYNNPANLRLDGFNLGLSAKNFYQFDGLYQFVLSGQKSTPFGNLGFGVSRYGDELMSESLLTLGYGRALSDDLSLGVSLYYVHEFAEFATNASTVFPQLGISYYLNDDLLLGVQARNPLQQELKGVWQNNLTSTISAGLNYQPNSDFQTSLQANLDSEDGIAVGLGLDYLLLKKVKLCFGGQTNPGVISAGILIPIGESELGIGGQYQSPLGSSPQFVGQTNW